MEELKKLARTYIKDDVKKVYITEDKNVFYEKNHTDAINHSKRLKIKVFTFTDKDLIEPKKEVKKIKKI